MESTVFHRHLDREHYELALEDEPAAAENLRRAAQACTRCSAALAEVPVSKLVAGWKVPAAIDAPIDWRPALKLAIAPRLQTRASAAPARRAIALAAVASLALVTLLAAPVAAASAPGTTLYPIRGFAEEVRYDTAVRSDRATLATDLATTYLWQARVSAGRDDLAGFHAAMDRFFVWAERARGDLRGTSRSERTQVRSQLAVARSLLGPIFASPVSGSETNRADSVLKNIQNESQEQNGEHQDGG